MEIFKLAVAFLAGLLTTLSPCVLPVLPFVTASSQSKSRAGPLALALGLLVTFVGSTLLIATSGFVLGLSPELLKQIAGILLAVSGLLFLSSSAQDYLAQALGRLVQSVQLTSRNSNANSRSGSVYSEFVGGLLLGLVWTPCSGPSLGTALGLASQAKGVGAAAVVLLCFGLGAIVPLLSFAYLARGLTERVRQNRRYIDWIKKVLGLLMVVFAVLIVSGLDRNLEAFFTRLLPDSWIRFTTKF